MTGGGHAGSRRRQSGNIHIQRGIFSEAKGECTQDLLSEIWAGCIVLHSTVVRAAGACTVHMHVSMSCRAPPYAIRPWRLQPGALESVALARARGGLRTLFAGRVAGSLARSHGSLKVTALCAGGGCSESRGSRMQIGRGRPSCGSHSLRRRRIPVWTGGVDEPRSEWR
ncbi:uncharacterized protein K452DRAFT_7485 [Aplosporella prunicola CBS 121167]|uniref:Uncharacterized protein n=1 Tax=Aplosporella prunicola CBS 121167 TaxID=1176127 RepID=A0A6A6BTI7_9PEZI|nr:uncharacterized protein K452DRAFT_7485 [Aplosporella prunicola CBS 121167]KAF2147439.1 hypothetical protein K452DRAFT_7485 [Aplosporella prunicola CBS 121167]